MRWSQSLRGMLHATLCGCAMQARWHGSTVAVKILRRSDEVGLGDFRTELNVLQKVSGKGRGMCWGWRAEHAESQGTACSGVPSGLSALDWCVKYVAR